MSKGGTVNIHGKQYKTVVLRVNEFRERCAAADGWGILTQIYEIDNERVIMKANIVNPDGITVGCGWAEEYRSASKINKTSALENCETSAIGRALASIGLGGEEYASADEVLRAIEQQKTPPPVEQKENNKEVIKEAAEDNNELIERVLANVERGMKVCGKNEYINWHKRVFANFYGIDENEISKETKGVDLLNDDQLLDFIDKQEIKLEGKEE